MTEIVVFVRMLTFIRNRNLRFRLLSVKRFDIDKYEIGLYDMLLNVTTMLISKIKSKNKPKTTKPRKLKSCERSAERSAKPAPIVGPEKAANIALNILMFISIVVLCLDIP